MPNYHLLYVYIIYNHCIAKSQRRPVSFQSPVFAKFRGEERRDRKWKGHCESRMKGHWPHALFRPATLTVSPPLTFASTSVCPSISLPASRILIPALLLLTRLSLSASASQTQTDSDDKLAGWLAVLCRRSPASRLLFRYSFSILSRAGGRASGRSVRLTKKWA